MGLAARTPSPDSGRRSLRGFTLAMCAVLITLMSIAVAAILPRWSTQIQREREAELIFRGLQMAEGIRVFQKRFGRYPVRLEELWETKPRSVRQAWKDPMTENGRWRPVLQIGAGVPGAVPGSLPSNEDEEDEETEGEDLPGDTDPVEQVSGAPIIGVRSRAKREALRTFFGQNQVQNWRFMADMVTPQGAPGAPGAPGVPGQGLPQIPNADDIGRPLPNGAAQPQIPGAPGVGVPGARMPTVEKPGSGQ